MRINDYTNDILEDINRVLSNVSDESADSFLNKLSSGSRIFTAGAGRSQLMMKAFAMRIMHLGMSSFVVGETITPSITDRDILIIGSGSGETATLRIIAERAKCAKATLAVITASPKSTIASMADIMLEIPASINHIDKNGNSWQPAGNSFEQSLLVLLDATVMMLADRKNIDISSALICHANLE